MIIVFGELSSIWGGQSRQSLTREMIRNGQELGINILNYAAQRYVMHHAMVVNPAYQSLELQTESDKRRITNMVDQLP
jgi:hypothetical protein